MPSSFMIAALRSTIPSDSQKPVGLSCCGLMRSLGCSCPRNDRLRDKADVPERCIPRTTSADLATGSLLISLSAVIEPSPLNVLACQGGCRPRLGSAAAAIALDAGAQDLA